VDSLKQYIIITNKVTVSILSIVEAYIIVMNVILILGDLTISVSVLYNYLENSSKIPWEDMRYLFGEIMYGGHITDDWDRRLCRTFLQEWLQVN
jgi:hypothetical protein